MNDKLDRLLKGEQSDKEPALTSKKFAYCKRKMNGICRSLSTPSKDYLPQKSVESIENYLKTPDRIDRVLYSEISSYIFSLDIPERGVFTTNAENLLHFSLNDENKMSEECRNIVLKIYDHSQLVIYQIENINNIFANSIEDAKNNLEKEIKGIQKEYISILGIFASIVFAFVGAITFSASVLQNISSANIFRLLLVVDLLAFIFLNIIYLLMRFVFIINEKEYPFFHIKWINITCLVIGICVIIAWLFNINALPYYISQYLPWG